MFSNKKNDWVSQLGNKLSFMEAVDGAEDLAPEAGETAAHEKKETPAAEKKEEKKEGKKAELDLDDMTPAQKIALIKSVIKHCNDKLEDEEFGDFMEKVSKVVEEYADEEEEKED